jgi:hypothetical protein
MDPQSVYDIVKYIQSSTIENKEEYFANKYKVFKQNYPILFEKACGAEKIDENMLQLMFNMVAKISNKETTQYDASVVVGQVLYDKYVDPVIKN